MVMFDKLEILLASVKAGDPMGFSWDHYFLNLSYKNFTYIVSFTGPPCKYVSNVCYLPWTQGLKEDCSTSA